MKKTKMERGITLIALLVTVAVLTILVAVAISGVQDDGIIAETKNSASEFEIAQEKENLQREVLGWAMKDTDTLANYFKAKFGEDKVQANADESITVEVESGNRYIVNEEGEVILLDGTVEEPETASTIEFTIVGTTFYAEEGMTWEEWCGSLYNVPDSNGVVFTVETGVVTTNGVYIPIADEANNKLLPGDEIIEGIAYVKWVYVD